MDEWAGTYIQYRLGFIPFIALHGNTTVCAALSRLALSTAVTDASSVAKDEV